MKKINFLQTNICLCWLIIMVAQGVAYAQQQWLSPDGDTLYIGEDAIIVLVQGELDFSGLKVSTI